MAHLRQHEGNPRTSERHPFNRRVILRTTMDLRHGMRQTVARPGQFIASLGRPDKAPLRDAQDGAMILNPRLATPMGGEEGSIRDDSSGQSSISIMRTDAAAVTNVVINTPASSETSSSEFPSTSCPLLSLYLEGNQCYTSKFIKILKLPRNISVGYLRPWCT